MGATSESIAGSTSSAVLADGGNAAASAATLSAAATIEKRRGRGRPPNASATGPGPANKRGVAQAQEEMSKALEALYDPKHWVGIVKAPADLMLALSGDDLWNLPKPEVDTLAAQSSLAARYFMATDPKWVALTLFAFSVATTYGTRAMMHIRKQREANA